MYSISSEVLRITNIQAHCIWLLPSKSFISSLNPFCWVAKLNARECDRKTNSFKALVEDGRIVTAYIANEMK